MGFLFASRELFKVTKYVYGLFTGGGTKAEDSKWLAVESIKDRWLVKTAEVSKVPLWAQTGAFSRITHSAINILLLWAAVVLARYSEDGLLIKLFTDEWFAGLPTRCLNETGFPEGIGCYSERVIQLRWSGVPSASRGFLVLCRNVCPVSARVSAAAQPTLALSEWLTDATQAAQMLVLVICIDALEVNAVFFFWTSGNLSCGFPTYCDGVFWKRTTAMGYQWL